MSTNNTLRNIFLLYGLTCLGIYTSSIAIDNYFSEKQHLSRSVIREDTNTNRLYLPSSLENKTNKLE